MKNTKTWSSNGHISGKILGSTDAMDNLWNIPHVRDWNGDFPYLKNFELRRIVQN